MLSTFNAIMNGLFNVVGFPFQKMSPLVGLVVISLLAGVFLLILFKYTSPQKAIKRVKDQIKARLYEVRLFKDDMGVVFKATMQLLKKNAFYIGCCTIPMVPLIVVVLPLLFQLDSRYGYDPLKPGDVTILDVTLDDELDVLAAKVEIDLPDGLAIDAGPVRIPSRHELSYRLRVKEKGAYEIGLKVNGTDFSKRIDAEEGLVTVSPARYRNTETFDAMMFPAEAPWPSDSPLKAVSLKHQRADMLGMDGDIFPWLIIFCIVGLAFGFALKGVFKVNF